MSLAVLVTSAVHLYTQSPPAFMDLNVYREGVQAWWHGKDMYGTLPITIAGIYLPFIYPPFAAVIFGPLAALPWAVAAITMLTISLVSLLVVIYLTVRHVWPAGGVRGAVLATAVLAALSMKLQPVWDTLWFGQVNLLLMLLVALDCLVARPKWPRGLLIGIAAAVKLTPAVFVLYFLLRKDYKAALTSAISGLAATLLGFVVNWSGSVEYWFGATGGARSVSGSTYYTNQTIDAFFARLDLAKHEQSVLWIAVTAVVFVFAVAAIRRAHALENAPLAMALTGCFGLLASPTSWGHHWVYVVPGLIVMAAYAAKRLGGGGYPAAGRYRTRVRWAAAFVFTALVFWYAPFELLPHANNLELTWNWLQQIPGNSYTIVGIALLVIFGAPELSRVLRDRFGQQETVTADTGPPDVVEPAR
ncbi:MAG TPA: glycosyltransferase 87 family protein [Pseudonocardiaceae bacterium]|nr:glycosyltransferase 87 family protein [Pseudonocardiaceae bacterium]